MHCFKLKGGNKLVELCCQSFIFEHKLFTKCRVYSLKKLSGIFLYKFYFIIYKRATLNKTIVDLDCFGKALEYVAISRVKTLSGLAAI